MIVRGGLTLKGHGRDRTLKGRSGRDTRPVPARRAAGIGVTFQGPIPAMRFQAQASGAHHDHHNRGVRPMRARGGDIVGEAVDGQEERATSHGRQGAAEQQVDEEAVAAARDGGGQPQAAAHVERDGLYESASLTLGCARVCY